MVMISYFTGVLSGALLLHMGLWLYFGIKDRSWTSWRVS
jgi:hypothetical protein